MVVYVDGPMNGFIEDGKNSIALLRAPDGKEIGRIIRRMMPWYTMAALESGIEYDRIFKLQDKAGIKPWGDPVYELKETDDPDIYKYVYIGEYEPLKEQGIVS